MPFSHHVDQWTIDHFLKLNSSIVDFIIVKKCGCTNEELALSTQYGYVCGIQKALKLG